MRIAQFIKLLLLALALCSSPAMPADFSSGAAPGPSLSAASALRHSERLALIKRRGTLIVGVKTDYPPFGTVNYAGIPIGFEHDLAEDLARRLGVSLSKVSVSTANRLQKLVEGSIDMVIATQGDTAERRRIATQIEPNYYASGVTLFVPPDSTLRDWPEVRGQKVCVTQGSYFNREMTRRYLLEPMMFNNARDAKLAVRDKRCVGFLYDNTALAADLLKPEWAGYKTPLPAALVTPWSIAIGLGEEGSDFEALVVDAVIDWHRSGFLIDRERAWRLPPSKFLQDMRAKWTRQSAQGDYLCQRLAGTRITPQCQNPLFLSVSDLSGLRSFSNLIKEFTSFEITMIYDAYDRAAFFSGLMMTLLLTVLCISGSLAVGIALAVAAESRLRAVRALILFAAVCGRMTPPLLQIYLVVFGIGSVLTAYGLSLSPLLAVIACLSIYTGSSIMVFILEAAALRRRQQPDYLVRVGTLPELMPHLGAPVVSALVNVAKATMMSSAVAIPELLAATTSIMSEHGNVATMMNIVLITFLSLIFIVVRALSALERFLIGLQPGGRSAS
jgi:polar amino acid transport system substrate-binding protein